MPSNDQGLRLPVAKLRAEVQRAGTDQFRLDHAHLPTRTIRTLKGNTGNLTYAGNLETGIW